MLSQNKNMSNPNLVDPAQIACNSLTPEQIEEYKRMGEYMFNNNDYNINMTGSKVKPPKEQDLLTYAIQGLQAGLDPKLLTEPELRALTAVYGEKWYLKFGLDDMEIPKPMVQAGPLLPKPISRNERRAIEREKKKVKNEESCKAKAERRREQLKLLEIMQREQLALSEQTSAQNVTIKPASNK